MAALSAEQSLCNASEPVRIEIAQLQRRYRSNLLLLLHTPPPNTPSYLLSAKLSGFTTTDPDFNKASLPSGITILLHFGKSLRDTRIHIDDQAIPQPLRDTINAELVSVCERLGGKARQVLKWLDRRIGDEKEIHAANPTSAGPHQANDEWTLNQQRALEEALAKFPAAMEKAARWKAIAQHVPGKSLKQCVARFNHVREKVLKQRQEEEAQRQRKIEQAQLRQVEERASALALQEAGEDVDLRKKEEEEEEGGIAKNLPAGFDLANFSGTRVVVEGLQKSNIGYLFATKAAAQTQCDKCGRAADVHLCPDANGKWKSRREWCKCGLLHSVTFHPILMHEGNSEMLAAVEEQGLCLKDVLSIDIIAACLECGSQVPFQDVIRARPRQAHCPVCNAHLHVLYEQLSLAASGVSDRRQNKEPVRYKKAGAKRDPRIVPGKPLPNNGTCKHYRKSYRWLRFPCCNKVFPCPVCHELGTSCVEYKWATRQVCGFCAHEQRFTADKPCAKCGKVIGVRKASAFWEGGKGCRDQTKMSAKDSKKYANSRQKTKSNKANRVGKAGKERALQKSAG